MGLENFDKFLKDEEGTSRPAEAIEGEIDSPEKLLRLAEQSPGVDNILNEHKKNARRTAKLNAAKEEHDYDKAKRTSEENLSSAQQDLKRIGVEVSEDIIRRALEAY